MPSKRKRREAAAVIYKGTVVQPFLDASSGRGSVHIYARAVVGLDAHGLIAFFDETEEDEEEENQDAVVIRLPPHQFLLPGLIDTHIHAPQFVYTGTATDIPLMEWLQRYTFPTESRLKDDLPRARRIYSHLLDCVVGHGTTTALYFATKDLEPTKVLAALAKEKGQRAYIGKVNMDRNAPATYIESTAESLHDTEAFIAYVKDELASPLVHPVLTPRFLPTCSEPLLQGLGALAAKHPGIHIQSHISESADHTDFNASLAAHHQGDSRDLPVFDRCGLLTPTTVLAHGIHLCPEELSLLATRGSGIAHCPLSNFFFGHGVFPVRKALERGVHVGLGTDVAGGYSPSMLSAVRSCVIASRVLEDGTEGYQYGTTGTGTTTENGGDGGRGKEEATAPKGKTDVRLDWKEALYLATMGGAQSLGIEETVGSFAEGKAFDAIRVDVQQGGSVVVLEEEEEGDDWREDLVQKYVNNADDRHVLEVWVQGREIKARTLAPSSGS